MYSDTINIEAYQPPNNWQEPGRICTPDVMSIPKSAFHAHV